ncbi:PP2C family protein-serine/threonine phosphatase [Halanaerobium praevalens]|uniref:Protein serine/threonine phosphatase n=1 Tax=Halanaerobium praevalens (strain ATCC 33744 / DSM 2228 / GSL) TaxID=572479 RepID=E3DNV0_HALPG|nr:PP2C family protein-serine/threonine phosphatase [Halanaerobium praevalens]ADO76574.1 protein serine/threonine phosphatase [Halanaerobium praevalens DSM 2228]
MKSVLFIFLAFFILIAFLIFKNLNYKNKVEKIEKNLAVKEKQLHKQAQKINSLELDIKTKLEKARNIHRRILPDQLVEPTNYLVVDYYQPAEYIGGDAYNFFKIEHELLAPFFEQYLLYFFDVSGHGIDSTLLAIFINEAIENYFKLRHNPGEKISTRELINYIDQQYQKEDFPDDYLVCLFIGVFDRKKNSLNYSCGGFQFPLYLSKPEAKLEKINIGGLPISSALGALTDSRAEKSIKIEANNTLILSTDGLLEENDGTENYNQRLERLLAGYSFLPAPFLKDLICLDFYCFTNGKTAADDITILFLERIAADLSIDFNLAESNFTKKRVEVLAFLKQYLDFDLEKIKLLKKLIKNTLQVEPFELKVKIIKKEEFIFLSLERLNKSKWSKNLIDLYPELISLTQLDLQNKINSKKNYIFQKDKIYITKNKMKTKLYFLVLKNNFIEKLSQI